LATIVFVVGSCSRRSGSQRLYTELNRSCARQIVGRRRLLADPWDAQARIACPPFASTILDCWPSWNSITTVTGEVQSGGEPVGCCRWPIYIWTRAAQEWPAQGALSSGAAAPVYAEDDVR
jgi:hypothetical protein